MSRVHAGLICGYKIQGVFKHQKLSFQGVFIASLLCLALTFDVFSLVNSNFKKALPPPGYKMHFKGNGHKCNINIKSVIIHKQGYITSS